MDIHDVALAVFARLASKGDGPHGQGKRKDDAAWAYLYAEAFIEEMDAYNAQHPQAKRTATVAPLKA
jgi:hypothetical protein